VTLRRALGGFIHSATFENTVGESVLASLFYIDDGPFVKLGDNPPESVLGHIPKRKIGASSERKERMIRRLRAKEKHRRNEYLPSLSNLDHLRIKRKRDAKISGRGMQEYDFHIH